MSSSIQVSSERLTIVNQRGLHARASAKFVNAVAKLPEGYEVTVAKDGTSANGGSILGLMMLGADQVDTVEMTETGARGEDYAIKAQLAGLIRDGFGEE